MTDKNRWDGIERPYNWGDVMSLRGSIKITGETGGTGSSSLHDAMKIKDAITSMLNAAIKNFLVFIYLSV